MKRIAISIATLMWVGCAAPDASPARLLGAVPFKSGATSDGACELSETNQYGGSLDIDANNSYRIAFNYEFLGQATPLVASDDMVIDTGSNGWVVDTINLRYT